MKNLILTFFALLLFVSCTEKQETPVLEKTPEALDDGGEVKNFISRGGGDLVEGLYNELAEKDPSLKQLETQLQQFHEEDSTDAFDAYKQKNKSYYRSADNYARRISDTLLRKKMEALIKSSNEKFDNRIAGQTNLLTEINKKTLTLNDLHTVIKLTYTLPLIEEYQKDKLPSDKPIKNYNAQLDKTLQYEESLIKK